MPSESAQGLDSAAPAKTERFSSFHNEETSQSRPVINSADDVRDTALDRANFVDSAPSSCHVPEKVTWSSMPKKAQLIIIVLARLAEPLSERSLTSYLFYQLRWFDNSLDDSALAYRAGLITAAFAAAQCATAMIWGRVADNPHVGRKLVLILGLVGSSVSAAGMGFTRSFAGALCFRIAAGSLNGNIGVLRTMISEIIEDKRYQSRAFLLLPMCFNVGVIIGPLLGGFLSDPASSFPNLFSQESALYASSAGKWMVDYPYALPNVVCALFLLCAAIAVSLGLDETHPLRCHEPDVGRKIGKLIYGMLIRSSRHKGYDPLTEELELTALEASGADGETCQYAAPTQPIGDERRGFGDLKTRRIILTMSQHFLQALHVSSFNALLFIMLPMARSPNTNAHLPFLFTGGAGLSSRQVGYANTIIGVVGIPVQLVLYPSVSARFGILSSYRAALPLSILAYTVLPFAVFMPDNSPVLWLFLILTLSSHVLARTFTTPATVILVNESAPCSELLGTVHGLAQSVSSAARMIGPTIGGLGLGWSLTSNIVGLPFWFIAGLATLNLYMLGQLKYITEQEAA